jgi:hypothetical protein
MEAYTNLYELLLQLAGPIGAAAWMVMLSDAIRNMRNADLNGIPPIDGEIAKRVRALTPLQLQTLVVLLALGVPSLAALILAFVPAEMIEQAQPTFAFLSMLLVVYLGQRVWYQITKPSRNLG